MTIDALLRRWGWRPERRAQSRPRGAARDAAYIEERAMREMDRIMSDAEETTRILRGRRVNGVGE